MPATYRAFADGVRPEMARADVAIPLRAIAVLSAARRFNDVDVVTTDPL